MFIVIEGIDGTGKATQTALLKEYYESQGKVVHVYDFPAYDSFVGKELGLLLSGKSDGLDASNLPGKLMAMLFSLDRVQFSSQLAASLRCADIIISNRYSLSNAAFQSIRCGGDISTWVYELEHEALGLPKPDLYLILKGSIESSHANVGKKNKRDYTDGHDLYESDLELLRSAQAMYCTINTGGVARVVIDCLADGVLKSKEEITLEIISSVEFENLPISALVSKSNIRKYVSECVTNDSLDLDLIVHKMSVMTPEHLDALGIMADRFCESDLGSMIGTFADCAPTATKERTARYIHALLAAKIYFPMMIETPENIKKLAIEEYCSALKTVPGSIALMNRYYREVMGD